MHSETEANQKQSISKAEAKAELDVIPPDEIDYKLSIIDLRKRAMVEALEKALGIVTDAALMCGVSRSAHYKWVREDEQYKHAVESIREMAIDMAESTLYGAVQAGNVQAAMFLLRNIGKHRGYTERQEITGSEGAPIIQIAGNL
jgi:hypothetical protein